MKSILHYIWKNKLIPKDFATTPDGEKIEVIQVGEASGTDSNLFCNARIKIGDRIWSGNVILHSKSSDWEPEIRKCGEASYRNVILHVTADNNVDTMRRHGECIPQLVLRLPDVLSDEYREAAEQRSLLPCHKHLSAMNGLKMHSYMSRLLSERIEEKSMYIERIHELCDKKWEQTLFKLMVRNFGFGLQGDTFEEWGKILDMQAMAKHRDNKLQIEAMFFGQAGLLDENTIPQYYRNDALNSDYYKNLLREYRFLSAKFNLRSINGTKWRFGNTTPHIRIARLAALYTDSRITLSNIASCNTNSEMQSLLQSGLQGYWYNHTQFGSTETEGTPPMRASQLDLIIINTIVPILYAYGKHRKDRELCDKAERILHTLRSEDNNIVRRWRQKGVTIECAADSQAIIQLQKAYCNKYNCIACHLAYTYIKEELKLL